MSFAPTVVAKDTEALRAEVRSFLAEELPPDHEPGLGMSAGHSPGFSARLAERGWVGMSLPVEYGGHGRSAVERFVVIEELLAAGAPTAAHWVSDRQTGPTILAYGTEAQRRRFLPPIAAGTCWFSLGMSEPDSGSDLASVRTNATRVDGGWSLNGTKVWTSGAHLNHYFVVLCRSSPLGDDRHSGLSQLIVDLSADGVTVNPIPFLDGTHHFNEVVLDDVFVPDDMVLGEVGMGWHQVTSELAYERAGPDRYLSTWQILAQFVRACVGPESSDHVAEAVGRLTARFWAIRQMSLSVAAALDAGQAPAIEAALVKDIGTTFEQEVIEVIRGLVDLEPAPGSPSLFERLLAAAILTGPSFTLRGGTTEVLRTVAAKGLSGR